MMQDKALMFAFGAHNGIGQKRKYTNENYFIHPLSVGLLIKTVWPTNDAAISVAYLHDTVEDTHITLYDIETMFGVDIKIFVGYLTEDKSIKEKREVRKQISRDRLSYAPQLVQTVKVADMIDNSRTIISHDPDFAKVWMKEMQLMLEVLENAEPTLFDRANQIVRDYYLSRLGE